jgi:hypothetical protein
MRAHEVMDECGLERAENIATEWIAGIQQRLFSGTPAAAAFCVSKLACMLDTEMSHKFQHCGLRLPGHSFQVFRDGEPRICAYSLLTWMRLLDAPHGAAASGSDQQGRVFETPPTDGILAGQLTSPDAPVTLIHGG